MEFGSLFVYFILYALIGVGVSDPLELELHTVVNCHVDAGDLAQ